MRTRPSVAVVLGSGLDGFAEELEDPVAIPYGDIPGWPRSTAIGHAGRLVFGRLSDVDLAVLSGRAHLYEGYSPGRVTYAMRIMHLLGARYLLFDVGGVVAILALMAAAFAAFLRNARKLYRAEPLPR